jgi:hypothetical protein
LPLSAFLGLLLFFVDGSQAVALLLGAGTNLWLLLVPVIVAVIVTCLAYAFWGALASVEQEQQHNFLGLRGGGFAVTGCLCIAGTSWFGLPGATLILGGALLGIGLSTLGIGWGIVMMQRVLPQEFRQTLIAFLLASIVKLMLSLLSTVALALVLLVLLIIAAAFLPAHISPASANNKQDNSATSVLELTKTALYRNWVVYCGLALCMSIFAFFLGGWGLA